MLCVRWYLSFKLSARDLVEMMTERGIVLAHTTILRWVQRYVPESKNGGIATLDQLTVPGDVTRLISR